MAKSDVLVRMRADTTGYDANIAKARKQLEAFKQENLTLGGVINQSSKSIVSAAAKYASFAAVLGTVVSGFQSVISEGTRMAKEMEGVKMAFDRLNQPGLLESLREATHGTVNDLELMKNAVKFDNFGLSLEQMGTFLAFAQQQAKDTGQSVEYLVDSIVTGLGRKSLPILDNLGLSATEIRERMGETGDMTKAVAEIIQERMEKAGGYIETAADRAAQAQVKLDNAMTDLGNTFSNLTSEANTLWTELEVGAINLLNTAIKPLIAAFNALASYANTPTAEDILTRGMTDVTDTVDDNGRLIRKDAINSIPEITITGNKPKKKVRTGGGSKSVNIADTIRKDYERAMLRSAAHASELKPEDIVGPSSAWQAYMDSLAKEFEQPLSPLQKLNAELEELRNFLETAPDTETYRFALGEITKKEKEIAAFKGENPMKDMEKDAKGTQKSFSAAAGAISAVGSALSSIDDPTAKIMGIVAQAIATIAQGFATATSASAGGGVFAWIASLAAGGAAMMSAIGAIHSATGYAMGGVIPGNSYSGDNQWARVNAGETILTRAQAGLLADALTRPESEPQQPYLMGDMIFLGVNNYTRASGQGEIVTTSMLRRMGIM